MGSYKKMFNTPPMVDMKRTPAETAADMPLAYPSSDYPYGLSISLDTESLAKLDVDFDSVEVGETYHLFVMAKVTAKSRHENTDNGPRDCIELQITHMGAESEDKENEEVLPPRAKMYKKK